MTAETLTIEALGPKGDGIHRTARGSVFIDRALPGDVIATHIRRGSGGALRGEVDRLITPSPHRAAPPCAHYDACGGCTLQHANTAFYRDWKIAIVRDALAKRGLEPETWATPTFLSGGNRRRVTFAAYRNGRQVTIGYFRRRTHHVTDITSCLIAAPGIMALRAKLAAALVPVLQNGKSTDVFIQIVGDQCEVAITGPVGTKGVPDLAVHEAFATLAQNLHIDRLGWRATARETVDVMLERRPVRARFGPLEVTLPPLAFLQPTADGEAALVQAVMDLLPIHGRFADLFCGCGTFTGPMLERGGVDAYDNVAAAIGALDKAKGALRLNCRQRDLFRDPLGAEELDRYDGVVFDPPRAGAQTQAAALARSNVPRLIAVSCDPVSFARDARLLVDGGYRLRTVKVVDQFTWSHHVELIAAFEK